MGGNEVSEKVENEEIIREVYSKSNDREELEPQSVIQSEIKSKSTFVFG